MSFEESWSVPLELPIDRLCAVRVHDVCGPVVMYSALSGARMRNIISLPALAGFQSGELAPNTRTVLHGPRQALGKNKK